MDKENNSENILTKFNNLIDNFEKIIDLQQKTIQSQKNTIESLKEVNIISESIIDIKDQTMDKLHQIIQILELRLKEFGIDLGDSLDL